jgi:methyltransferase
LKLFYLFWVILILQRLVELKVAKNNERWMKSQGGIEFGQKHYRIMVGLHSLFFIFYMGEVFFFQKEISSYWPVLLFLFILTQSGRVWALTSLGKYWNTKIIVLPNADVIKKGPYKYVKHPNYLIVTLEFIIVPLMFQAYITMILFSILNVLILSVRIPEEERALKELTGYGQSFNQVRRFFPKI